MIAQRNCACRTGEDRPDSKERKGKDEKMRKIRALSVLAAIVAVLGVFAVGQTPASAHYRYIYHGKDIATISDDHHYGTVCDREADGHYVYAEYDSINGVQDVYDSNGSARGCDTAYFPIRASAFRLCEQHKGCTAWHRT